NTLTIPRPPAVYGAEGNFSVFLCPSAPPVNPSSTVIQNVTPPGTTANVDWNGAFGGAGNVWFSSQPGAQILGRTNYLPSGGDPRPRVDRNSTTNPQGRVDAHGLFYFQSKENFARVTDGTSNTIAFAESAGGLFSAAGDQFFGTDQWILQAWAGAVWWVGYGVCPNTIGAGANCRNTTAGLGLSVYVPGSTHSGGIVNVALADGSVRSLNVANIDSLSLAYLTGVRDGEVQTLDF